MTEYAAQERPDLDELERVYRESGLAERRPMDRLAEAHAGANLWVTAREEGRLVGVARLAVARDRQRTGVGREIVRRTAAASPQGFRPPAPGHGGPPGGVHAHT